MSRSPRRGESQPVRWTVDYNTRVAYAYVCSRRIAHSRRNAYVLVSIEPRRPPPPRPAKAVTSRIFTTITLGLSRQPAAHAQPTSVISAYETAGTGEPIWEAQTLALLGLIPTPDAIVALATENKVIPRPSLLPRLLLLPYLSLPPQEEGDEDRPKRRIRPSCRHTHLRRHSSLQTSNPHAQRDGSFFVVTSPLSHGGFQ